VCTTFPLHVGSKRLPYWVSFGTLVWHCPSSRFSWVREKMCALWVEAQQTCLTSPGLIYEVPPSILHLPLHSYSKRLYLLVLPLSYLCQMSVSLWLPCLHPSLPWNTVVPVPTSLVPAGPILITTIALSMAPWVFSSSTLSLFCFFPFF
jgi:hypothetical protein